MSDTINVVGAGIAGSLVTRLLHKNGFTVRVFDDQDKYAGSMASSNLFIASWLKKFESSSARLGISVLEELFKDKIDQPFERGIADAAKVKHIAQRHLLVDADFEEEVRGLYVGGVETSKTRWPGRTVLCCGARIAELAPGEKVDALVGHCVFLQGKLPPGFSSLTMPLPYRHFKLYQYSDNQIYFADSTAVKKDVYWKRREELQAKLLERARAATNDLFPVLAVRVGYRPCLDGFPFGKLTALAPGVWSVNGGGKNGLVAYAALAHRLVQELFVLCFLVWRWFFVPIVRNCALDVARLKKQGLKCREEALVLAMYAALSLLFFGGWVAGLALCLWNGLNWLWSK